MAFSVEVGYGLVDLLVGVRIEIFLADDLQDVADDAVIPHHAAQDRSLGFLALRRQPVSTGLVGRHGHPEPARAGEPNQVGCPLVELALDRRRPTER